jgi:hypothetical protein
LFGLFYDDDKGRKFDQSETKSHFPILRASSGKFDSGVNDPGFSARVIQGFLQRKEKYSVKAAKN